MPTQEWIRAALKEKGHRLKDVAQALNVPAPRVTDILKGQRAVQSDEVIPLAEMLDMNAPSLLKSLEQGKRTIVPTNTDDRLPLRGAILGDGTVADLAPEFGFASVPLPPDATKGDGLYCYVMGDGSMAQEIAENSLIIAADPKVHYAPIVPGSILLVDLGDGRLTFRQYTRSDGGEDWLVPLPNTPNPAYKSWRFSLLSALMPGANTAKTDDKVIRIDSVLAVVLWVHRRHAPKPPQG